MAIQYFEFAFSESELISLRGTEDWCQERLESVGHLGSALLLNTSNPKIQDLYHQLSLLNSLNILSAIKPNHEIPWRFYIAPHIYIYIHIIFLLYVYYIIIYIFILYIYIIYLYYIFMLYIYIYIIYTVYIYIFILYILWRYTQFSDTSI